jgi:two-component system response regulator FlrC
MKLGATDFVVKPYSMKVMESVVKKTVGIKENHRVEKKDPFKKATIITKNHRMLKLLDLAKTVADSKAPVFIQGESGTGKELFARFIHNEGFGHGRPFVPLNCAALPSGLLESELFGHEKGAFTGAVSRKLGKFELAQGGTILLDEISEMDINLQAKLLRVLQELEIDRVGGKAPIPIDVRVIATTNLDIEDAVKSDKFRADLFYRLNVIPITLPPLRERREDIIPLAQHFLEKYNRIDGRDVKGFTEDVQQTLTQMDWPGNVRELENMTERAVLLCQGEHIDRRDLFISEAPNDLEQPAVTALGSLKEMEQKMIFRALDQTNGNRTHAADILGISVRTLRNKLNEYRKKMDAI